MAPILCSTVPKYCFIFMYFTTVNIRSVSYNVPLDQEGVTHFVLGKSTIYLDSSMPQGFTEEP